MLMRHIDNSWKISDFDTIFYLTHPNHVGKTQWVPCALPVGNVASHVFSWCSGKVQLLKSAGSFPGRRVAVAAVLTGLWGRSVGHISGHGDTWCAGGWSWGRAGWWLVAVTCPCDMMAAHPLSSAAQGGFCPICCAQNCSVCAVALQLSDVPCSLGPGSAGSKVQNYSTVWQLPFITVTLYWMSAVEASDSSEIVFLRPSDKHQLPGFFSLTFPPSVTLFAYVVGFLFLHVDAFSLILKLRHG